MKLYKIGLLFYLAVILLLPSHSFARTTITDWYIKDFSADIIINKDSSVDIVEKITADCGDLSGKHGIFRVLPTSMVVNKKIIKLPVILKSITDFNGSPQPYSTLKDRTLDTVTWKIGDANKTVTGINYYKISYKVKNAVRFHNTSFDELYWNLNGNFWDIETDAFQATIHFPSKITSTNSQVYLYSGSYGARDIGLADYVWQDVNTINVTSLKTISEYEGITISVTFPKHIFTPYKPTFWEAYGQYFWLLIPLFTFLFCLLIWRKYGNDPNINPTIVPEFAPPRNLAPFEMGLLYSNNKFRREFLAASLVNLATKGIVTISQIEKKGVLKKDDYNLKLNREKMDDATTTEKILTEKMFKSTDGNKEITLSSLENHFYTAINSLHENAQKELTSQGLLKTRGRIWQYIFIFLGCVAVFLCIVFAAFSGYAVLAFVISALIYLCFSFVMPNRPLEGLKVYKQIEGFKLYIDTAEKYRQQFFEKENIFERFLPYAILFGLTAKWIQATRNLYQAEYKKDYFSSYHPIWFTGAAISSFNVDSFTSSLNSVSSSMSSAMTSSPSSSGSGSGGGGFSGGGGGGGGGGGW